MRYALGIRKRQTLSGDATVSVMPPQRIAKHPLTFALAIMVFFITHACIARIIVISQPDASYLARTRLLPITADDFTAVSSLTDETQTVLFGTPMEARTVASTWLTWGSPPDTEGDSPRVLWSTEDVTTAMLTYTLPSRIVGFEVEPDFLGIRSIMVIFFSGATPLDTLSLDVDGFAGAKLFAIESTSALITRVTIDSEADFAIAQLRYGLALSEPGSLQLLGVAMLLVAFVFRNKPHRGDLYRCPDRFAATLCSKRLASITCRSCVPSEIVSTPS